MPTYMIFAIRDLDGVTRYVGKTQADPHIVARHLFPEDDRLTVAVLETVSDSVGVADRVRREWIKRLSPMVQPVKWKAYASFSRMPSPDLPPSSVADDDVEDEPTVRFVDIPECALVAAIRLRTDLYPYEEIARRLTDQGQPPGVVWQPADVRSLIQVAFTSWPRDPTPKYR